jgi:TGF-beta propeptide
MRHEHGRRLWFDITEIGQDVTLMMAELRMYQNSIFSKFDDEKPLTLSVYMVESRDEENHEILKLLASKNTTTHSDGWLELNVTHALTHWIEDKASNLGLVIKASLNERPEKELRLDDFGLVNSKGDDEFQPFMAGFFKGQEVSDISFKAFAQRADFIRILDDQTEKGHRTPPHTLQAPGSPAKAQEEDRKQKSSHLPRRSQPEKLSDSDALREL